MTIRSRAIACLLSLLPLPGMAQAGEPQLPSLALLLKPHTNAGQVDYVDGKLDIERPNVAAGGTLLRMPLVIVSIPTARYDGDAVKAVDAQGEVPLAQQDEAPGASGTYRRWIASRATAGDVTVSFRAPPRAIAPTTRNGPLFDLRADGAGVLGAGITFIPLPDNEAIYRIAVRWDLSGLPAGSRGVTSLGQGEVHTVGPAQRLAFNFYVAGPMRSHPPEGSEQFAMYWLSDLPFDPAELAASIRTLYQYMSAFFQDEGAPYRVFVRKNANRGTGGTALPASFMFGWNEEKASTPQELQSLLSHEMAHNWPGLEGEHAETSWYSEGAAEYYSIVLSYRSGVMSPAQFLEAVNQRATGYYTNPYLNSSGAEAAKAFWNDWSAQRVPYGRGFMYLAQVDAQIRARSGGRRSLDDLVVPLFLQKKQGKPPGIADWLKAVEAELGPRARGDYEAMVAGRTLVPPANAFAPCFKPVRSDERRFELGMASNSFNGEPKVVQGLVTGSAAQIAGLRNGDAILEFTDPLEAEKHLDAPMRLRVRRAGQQLEFEYSPLGETVAAYHWQRVASVPAADCKI